jgi:DeoR family transcriptional regulator, fructose operon transcriptional repressor
MNFQIRKHKILEILNHQDSVEVSELAVLLEISEITVRRDLNTIAEMGLIERTHGGAVRIGLNSNKVGFNEKNEKNSKAKEEIAKKAASLIKDGDAVFLDCGSTVFKMCKYLKSKNITAITNSVPVLTELLGSEVKINFIGGQIDAERKAAHGTTAIEHIGKYKVNKAFVGIDGISLETGLSANTEKEAEITLAMLKNARESFFLCDSTKIENDKYFVFAGIETVKNLIVDSELGEEYLESYKKAGIKII